MLSEPSSLYIAYLTPNSGSSTNIMWSNIKFVKIKAIEISELFGIGCDGTKVNVGKKMAQLDNLNSFLTKFAQVCVLVACYLTTDSPAFPYHWRKDIWATSLFRNNRKISGNVVKPRRDFVCCYSSCSVWNCWKIPQCRIKIFYISSLHGGATWRFSKHKSQN